MSVPRGRVALGAALASALGAVSCAPPDGAEPVSMLVVGITSDLAAPAEIAKLHVQVRADGEAALDRLVGGAALALPLAIAAPPLRSGARVDVRVEAFGSHYNDATPVLVRDAATRLEAGPPALLRLHLERDCVPTAILAGGATAPTCDAPNTCIAAECVDPFVAPGALEAYGAHWSDDWSDACRAEGSGAPEIQLGLGKTDFTKLAPGDPVPLELGPQGGHHAWIALRMRGVHRFGARATVRARDTTAGVDFLPSSANHTLALAGDGACDLVGLRYQVLDQAGVDRVDLVGDALELSADVTDANGAVAHAALAVVLE